VAEFWEPWTPKIGDRVRVRLSVECDAQFRRSARGGDLSNMRPHAPRGHYFAKEDGEVGHVEGILGEGQLREHRPVRGHRFAVRYESDPTKIGGYAAIELEPLNG
jgi:hypothetical protein